MKKILVLLFVFISFANIIKSSSVKDYSIGDKYYFITRYLYYDDNYTPHTESVVKDTLINQTLFYVIDVNYPRSKKVYERADGDNIYRYDNINFKEDTLYHFNVDISDTFIDSVSVPGYVYYELVTNIQNDTIFGEETTVVETRTYHSWFPDEIEKVYSTKFSLLSSFYLNGEMLFMSHRTDLIGAYINNIMYGDSIYTTNISSNVDLEFALYQNYPNPFNPDTTISYSLTNDSQVNVKVYDIAGREVCDLVDQKQNKGSHEVNFDGALLASGIYFYSLSIDGKTIENRKMMLLK